MKKGFCLHIIGVFLLSQLSFLAMASGSVGPNIGRTSGQAITDPVYEQGKAVFNGRIKEYGKLKYCLAATEPETEVVKIKRKSMKRYKKQNVQALVNDLRFCDKEAGKVLEVLSREHLSYLLYYLNKRYRLKLT